MSGQTSFARVGAVSTITSTSASGELGFATGAAGSVVNALITNEGGVREAVDRKLAARGLDGTRIKEFQALNPSGVPACEL